MFVFAPAILRGFRLRLQLDAKRTKKVKAVNIFLENYGFNFLPKPKRYALLHSWISHKSKASALFSTQNLEGRKRHLCKSRSPWESQGTFYRTSGRPCGIASRSNEGRSVERQADPRFGVACGAKNFLKSSGFWVLFLNGKEHESIM